jgi:DNA replication protein DnaC
MIGNPQADSQNLLNKQDTMINTMPLPNERHQGHCEKHGDYPLNKFSGFNGEIKWLGFCVACRDDEQKEEALKRTKDRVKSIKQYSGLPERFKDFTFVDYKTDGHEGKKKALETITGYGKDFPSNKVKGRCMTLLGFPGTGKTMLAGCLVNAVIEKTFCAYEEDKHYGEKRLIEHDVFAHYKTEYELIRKIKNCWAKNSEITEETQLDYFCEPDLLVIDEIGISFGSEADKILLYQVINGRYEKTLPTILISNLNHADLTKYTGERIMDRMRENQGIQLTFNWESFRR